jgi:hypothetical protein
MAKKPSSYRVGDPVIMHGEITIPDGDELTGEKTVVVKLRGYGIPIRVTTAYIEKAGRRILEDVDD